MKRDNLRCELIIGNVNIKQILIDNEKCDTEMQRRTGIAKDAFQKTEQESFETEKSK